MEAKISKDLRNPSNVIIVAFLYLLAKNNKIKCDPYITEVKLRITYKVPSQIHKHFVVELDNTYILSFYCIREQIGLCLWPAGGLLTKEGAPPLINCEINTFNQLFGGHNSHFFEGSENIEPFVNQVSKTVRVIKTDSYNFINNDIKDGIKISRDHIKFLIENINCCKDHLPDMMKYFDIHIENYLKQNNNGRSPM